MASQVKRISKYDIDTPALLIDLDLMEANIKIMADYFSAVKANLRPHIKTHKSPIIAHKQIEAGAIGVTCQKLGEAEVAAQAGIKGILISNQVANSEKIRRLVNLSKWADITVGMDDMENAEDISRAAEAVGTTINVVIEIAFGRCGVDAGEPALALAKRIVELKGLKFKGLFSHQGSYAKFEERKRMIGAGIKKVIDTKHLLEDNGIPVKIVSAGCTENYDIAGAHPEVTDVQAGSYIFMDWPYVLLEGMEIFHCALTALTTIISKPKWKGHKNRIITDCGLKSMSSENTACYYEFAGPKVKDIPDAEAPLPEEYPFSEDHGEIRLFGDSIEKLKIGDKIELIPSHSCTTVNLHDQFYGIRNGYLECIWPVSARGKTT